MSREEILEHLKRKECVLTNAHFVYTSRNHGRAYINLRRVAHDAVWLDAVSGELANRIAPHNPGVVIGPETLGRTLATLTAVCMARSVPAIWCDMRDAPDGEKLASFSPKLDFGRLVRGKRVAVVDDLLTSGSSIRGVVRLISEFGGEVVVVAVVVRRTPDVNAATCNAPALEILADVEGFEVFTPEECAIHGPCSQQVPVVLRPGHGHEWIKSHKGYPSA